MAVLGKVCDQPAADQIDRAPAGCAVQAGKDAFRGIARRAAGVDGLLDLTFLRLLRSNLLFQAQDAFRLLVPARFQRLAFVCERLRVTRFAAVKRSKLAFVPGDVLPDGFQFAPRALVLGCGGAGLLLFLASCSSFLPIML